MRCLLPLLAFPALVAASDFSPDPLAVRRHGPAYRYPQAGWTVLHIEGKPFERGYQHGSLMATEIAAFVRCFATQLGPKDSATAWQHTRRLANALFLRRFDREYLEEMKGIAEGAADHGATVYGRPIDLTDIACLNLWPEIETLDGGLEALPTGFEGMTFPGKKPKAMPAPKPEHCSAFAATGPATADGKVVIGHITMFGLAPSRFFNVWLDVSPVQGHRVLMQSYPGGIQSGMDYYMNSAGLVVCETTIAQTRFEADAVPLASRIRKALQYGNSIDDVVKVLQTANNGLYTNEWLIADTKTNEIAMFELGTKATKLWRSSKDEWFGGTKGFYWGCNNTKDIDVRLDTFASLKERPQGTAWVPSARDKKWMQFFMRHEGKITAEIGRLAFTTPPICAASSLDAKITTTDLMKDLRTHAIFGPPIGGTWQPTDGEKAEFPEIVPLVPNDWTVLHPKAPAAGKAEAVVDWPDKAQPFLSFGGRQHPGLPETRPAWRGTLLPKSDADLWLTEGFAAYERIVALEQKFRDDHDGGDLSADERERLAVELGLHRAQLRITVTNSEKGAALIDQMHRDERVRTEASIGALYLDHLRAEIGHAKFVEWMDDFGTAYAGQRIDIATFGKFLAEKKGPLLKTHFAKWMEALDIDKRWFTVRSWAEDREHTAIVYGTTANAAANRETAEQMRKTMTRQGANIRPRVLADAEALKGLDSLKIHHILLVGGPSENQLTKRWAGAFPVQFGPQSFRVRDKWYAHPGSAVIAAGPRPDDGDYSAVVIAGLSAESTQFAPPYLFGNIRAGNVLVLPNQGVAKSLVVK